jgi:NitT/TauT family transport system ATP-binding protein
MAGAATSAPRGRLELLNVGKRFQGSDTFAVRGITLRCEPGEFVVLVGPSGCGKSTLLNLAAGILPPDEGSVMIDGRPVRHPGPDRAVVFQEHGLFPWLDAIENVAFGLKMAGVAKQERLERAAAALRTVNLAGAERKLVHQLSGGMRQRVSIARALVIDPAVLLMDEPFAALDAQTRTLLHGLLQEIWVRTRKTVLFVTHSVGEAVRLADRVVVLHTQPGRIRREVPISIPHPRDFDSGELAAIGHTVRVEIEEEVKRVHSPVGAA